MIWQLYKNLKQKFCDILREKISGSVKNGAEY